MFAIEHAGVEPDLVTMAKSRWPAAFRCRRVIGRAEIMDAAEPGGLGGTYAGNPIACAAALAVLDVIEEEKLLERAKAMGARIEERLHSWRSRNDLLADRARSAASGAMIGLRHRQGARRRSSRTPPRPSSVTPSALEKGSCCCPAASTPTSIRILVPLTAADAIVDEGLDIFERSLKQVAEAVA